MSMTQTMRQLPVQQARTYDYLYGKSEVGEELCECVEPEL